MAGSIEVKSSYFQASYISTGSGSDEVSELFQIMRYPGILEARDAALEKYCVGQYLEEVEHFQ